VEQNVRRELSKIAKPCIGLCLIRESLEMAGRRCTTGPLVVALMLAFHGERLALSQATKLTREQIGIQEWQKVLDKFPEAVQSGLGVGETCRKVHGLELSWLIQTTFAEILVGKTAEELESIHQEGGELVFRTGIARGLDNTLKNMQDFVNVSDMKKYVCKTSENLYCSNQVCKSCKCADTEEGKKHCEEVVGKILKDRKLEAPAQATCE